MDSGRHNGSFRQSYHQAQYSEVAEMAAVTSNGAWRGNHQQFGEGLSSQNPLLGPKSNSCSTIFISDSTASQPNLKYMLKAVALAVYFHLRNPRFGSSNQRLVQPPVIPGLPSPAATAQAYSEIFDERLHPLWLDPANGGDPLNGAGPETQSLIFSSTFIPKMPDFRTIYRYFRMLFHSAQLTAECAVVSLVYLERIITCAELQLTPATWRRLSLGSILLASKVWDDQAVWNVDFCSIIKNVSVEEMNELERLVCYQYLFFCLAFLFCTLKPFSWRHCHHRLLDIHLLQCVLLILMSILLLLLFCRYFRIVLELIQFNINVPSSVYTKYFFDLRTLATEHGLILPVLPLSRERAAKLEAVSWIKQQEPSSSPQLNSSQNHQDPNGTRPETEQQGIVLFYLKVEMLFLIWKL